MKTALSNTSTTMELPVRQGIRPRGLVATRADSSAKDDSMNEGRPAIFTLRVIDPEAAHYLLIAAEAVVQSLENAEDAYSWVNTDSTIAAFRDLRSAIKIAKS